MRNCRGNCRACVCANLRGGDERVGASSGMSVTLKFMMSSGSGNSIWHIAENHIRFRGRLNMNIDSRRSAHCSRLAAVGTHLAPRVLFNPRLQICRTSAHELVSVRTHITPALKLAHQMPFDERPISNFTRRAGPDPAFVRMRLPPKLQGWQDPRSFYRHTARDFHTRV